MTTTALTRPGAASIDPDATMRELLEQFPGAQRALFQKYHIGGCSSCGFRPDETLTEVCARNDNLSVAEAIDHIRASHEADAKIRISPTDLSREIAQGSPRLLDIRTREEFEAARIDGSVLFTQELMQEILSRWDREQTLAIIDHVGARSMDAASFFAGHGFSKVRSVAGGIDAWSTEIDPNVPRYSLE